MDDLEFNGCAPRSDEPPKEPEQTQQESQPGFYAWSGTSQPQGDSTLGKKESPYAQSPYVRVSPAPQRPVQGAVKQNDPKDCRKRSPLPLLSLLACIGTMVLTLVIFLAMNGRLDGLQNDLQKLNAQLNTYGNRIEHLEDKLKAQQSVTAPQQTATHDTPVQAPTAEGVMTPAQVYAQCVPSVVAINCTGTSQNGYGQVYESASSGSGFVLSEDGYIVTNYHVVEGSTKIEICMYDGTTYNAEYIGGNEANDIALVKVDAQNLPPVVIGSSSDLIVGDQVAAIGNPLGELASTLTVGYVSAKDRIVTSEGTQINMLQTDAAINPGNSGGPLFNMYGQVVGITSAKYSGTTESGATIEGIGFAIPTDDVMMMLEDLRTFGYVTGGYLGVTVTEVSEEAVQWYGIPQGVLVRDVMPGSCAETAGMRSQDIIVSLGGSEVKNLNDLSRALNKCKAGQEVIVTVYRSGTTLDLTVLLDERPQEETPQVTEPVTEQYVPWPGNGFLDDWFGQFFG